MTSPMAQKLPAFEDLPLREGDPPFSAWGLWDNPALGSLNYLTDALVLKAMKEEVHTGERVGLNLPLDAVAPALLGRIDFEQKLINKAPRIVNDDVITFNTQGSSQWDSFRHFAYQAEAKFYNGVTQEDIHETPNSTVNGVDGWADKAIAGRGILIDYESWANENGIEYKAISSHAVPVEHVKAIMKEKSIIARPGDIFLLRTGYAPAYVALDATGKQAITTKNTWPGLKQGEEMMKWLWEQQFAAVASDAPAFECVPPVDPKWLMHPILLAGWGTPIGELFDLEGLSALCKKNGRWTFFFTSAPLNYRGAVASPPNAIAIL